MSGPGRLTGDASINSRLINQGGGQPVQTGERASEAAPVPHEAQLISTERQAALRKTINVDTRADVVSVRDADYVFVGAGATGSAATGDLMELLKEADRLRAQGHTVLVLEGGDDKKVKISEIPVGHGAASEDKDLLADPNRNGPGKGTGYWVTHHSDKETALLDPKARREDGKVWKPRGEGFGGSARMNAMVYIRVDDVDWNKIALATGDPAWRAENMKPLFKELEKVKYRPVLNALHNIGETLGLDSLQNLRHGYDGQIEITRADPRLLGEDEQIKKIALRGLLWAGLHLGTPMENIKRLMTMFDPNDDMVQGTAGAVIMPTTIDSQGRRTGARNLLMNAAKAFPDELKLQDGARVQNLLFDDTNRCTGLVYKDMDGKEHRVNVKREVIVAAGAMETPALLMRSGIGPRAELEKLKEIGVEPRVILEGVGQKQGDRYEVGVVFDMKKPFKLLDDVKIPPDPNSPTYQKWEAGRGGPYASNGPILSMQARSSPDQKEPDLFIFAVPGDFRGYKPGYSAEATADPHKLTFLVLHANKGEGKGTLQIDPDNPFGAPIINHHFHKERQAGDSLPIVAGIEDVRKLVQSQFADMIDKEVWPGTQHQTRESLAAEVEKVTWGHHPRGGAQMGHANDPNTVVDSNFKVLGTTGLRVIDASMLPDNIGTFIVSGLYQIGKLAARKIARDAEDGPKPAASFNPLSIRNAELPANLEEAKKVTQKTADAALAAKTISRSQHERMTDGTVSSQDIDVAWKAIEGVLKNDDVGSDKHTVVHNLLLALTHQLDHQSTWQTESAKFMDKAVGLFPPLGMLGL